ncbi:MAG: N-acetylmuramoyl-L-alanine amidase [Hydrogenoanaerobacterium sp.]
MSNSTLVNCIVLSPNHNAPRNKEISKITIHHVAGVLGAESIGACFAGKREASSNYGIGNDGRVGMYVEEKNRAWTSSSGANDNRAVTIEVSNSKTGGEWPVSDSAYATLLDLCVDICKRNGIPKLIYDGTPNGTLTHHQMFAATACPGPYLLSRFTQICNEVNSRLNGTVTQPTGHTSIMGIAVATAEQLTAYVKKKNADAPNLAQIFIDEGKAEGVRGDIAFAQSCLETGNFTFCGDVKPNQNNYAGIGATGGGVPGNSFDTPQFGVRAQIQHLKAYASTDTLKCDCVDPRFKYVTRGSATYVEWLGIPDNPNGKGWAAGENYGAKILAILTAIIGTSGDNTPTEPPAPICKSVEEIASEVLAGKWGNGQDRKEKLTAAGYDYSAVQNAVNAKLGNATVTPQKTVTEIAKEVIRGEWGNGQDRKNRLVKAGYNYSEVQNAVNRLV